MPLLKDDMTARLDDLTRTAEEALGVYRDLEARIEDPQLKSLLARHIDAHARAVQRIAGLRRARGDLPQAADPERAHLEAVGAYLRAVVLPGETTAHYAKSLLDEAAKVSTRLDEALRLDLDPELERLLTEFRATNRAFEQALRPLASA